MNQVVGFAFVFAFVGQAWALGEVKGPGLRGDKEKAGIDEKASWAKEIIGQYKWVFSFGFVAILVCSVVFGVVKMIRKNEDTGDEQEEKIVLVSRKIRLPASAGLIIGEKVELSRDFGEKRKQKEPQGIYKETLIRKLNLSKV